MRLTVTQSREALVTPYILPFGTITHYDAFFVVLEGNGHQGVGEITPLPGYSDETPKSVAAALSKALGASETIDDLWAKVDDLTEEAPFVASGIACALETWDEGLNLAYQKPLKEPLPLIGLCQGNSLSECREKAVKLFKEGFRTLKLKVGSAPLSEDLAKLKAVAEVTPEKGLLRLDANQVLTWEAAIQLCQAIQGENWPVELLEQPFHETAWNEHAQLIEQISVPLMLDESIHTLGDIEKAKIIGAAWVKMKLCKHPGIRATVKFIQKAKEIGLGVVFGNGVQTAIGNHLEARIHQMADLQSASEANGWFKISHPLVQSNFAVQSGQMFTGGIPSAVTNARSAKIIYESALAS